MIRLYGSTEVRKNGDDRTYEFIISNATKDRHRTVIPITAWNLENYNKNGIVAYQHETSPSNADPDLILGPGRAYVDGDKLVGQVTFETEDINPLAEKIKKKIDFGTIKATSVGFIEKSGHFGNRKNDEDPDTYYFDEVELLEFSIVNIPSNPDAVIRKNAEVLHDYIEEKMMVEMVAIHEDDEFFNLVKKETEPDNRTYFESKYKFLIIK